MAEDLSSLERELQQYRDNLERLATIVELHTEELEKINTELELTRKQRKHYRETLKKLQTSRITRGENEPTPVEEKFLSDLEILNHNLEQLDFRYDEQAEFLEIARKEFQLERSEIQPKISELEKKLAELS